MDNNRKKRREHQLRSGDRRNNEAKSKRLQAVQEQRFSISKKSGRPRKELTEEKIEAIKLTEYSRCNAIVLQISGKRGYNISKNKTRS